MTDDEDWEFIQALINLPVGALLVWASVDLALEGFVTPVPKKVGTTFLPSADWVDVEFIGLVEGLNWMLTIIAKYEEFDDKADPFLILCKEADGESFNHHMVTKCINSWLRKEIGRDDIVVIYNDDHLTKMEINYFNATEGFKKL